MKKKSSATMIAALTVFVIAGLHAAENAAPVVKGKIVTRPGEQKIQFLSFRDQQAADRGEVTRPQQTKVESDGSFIFPQTLPEGYTLATTPPCVAVAGLASEKPVEVAGSTPIQDPLLKLGNSTVVRTIEGNISNARTKATETQKFTGNEFSVAGYGAKASVKAGGINLGCAAPQAKSESSK